MSDKFLKLTIKSDGTPRGTGVFTDDDNKLSLPVTSIDYHIGVEDVGTVKLGILGIRSSFDVAAHWSVEDIRHVLNEVHNAIVYNQELELQLKTLLVNMA